jgi:arylesterase/paraoxonase
MRSILKWTLITLAVLLVIVAIQVVRRLEAMGQFTSIDKVSPGTCRVIAGPPGVEDLQIDHASRIALLSSDDRRAAMAGTPVNGGIYALPIDTPDSKPRLLTGEGSGKPAAFHPHGISLYVAPDGTRTLMVVNHRNPGAVIDDPSAQSVEIFDVTGAGDTLALTHRRTIHDADMTAPNDLVAVSPDSFYVTNMVGSRSGLGVTLEGALGLARSYVLYFDGSKMSRAVEGLSYANGINVSLDGKTLYVAEALGRRLSAYDRNAATGAVALKQDGFFGTGLDNIDIAPDGALWIGAHPRMIDFLMHASSSKSLSSSQILRIEPQAGGAARTLYTNDGGEISAVSAAVTFTGTDGIARFLAGAVFDPKLLLCDWTAPTPPGPPPA